MFFLELGQAVGYFHKESGWAFVLQKMEQPPLVGNIPALPGAATPNRTLPLPQRFEMAAANSRGVMSRNGAWAHCTIEGSKRRKV